LEPVVDLTDFFCSSCLDIDIDDEEDVDLKEVKELEDDKEEEDEDEEETDFTFLPGSESWPNKKQSLRDSCNSSLRELCNTMDTSTNLR
jgi:hypothetical protein